MKLLFNLFTHRPSLFGSAVVAMVVALLSGANAQADYESAVLAANPIGYWRFNESAGDTAVDLGSNGIDGEYIGGQRVASERFTLVDGREVQLGAGNLAFDVGQDIDEYMTVPEPIMSDLSEFTMTGWVNPSVRAANRIGLFGQNDAIEFGFISPNQIQMWTPADATNYAIDPDTQIPEDTWFHLATVGTGSSIDLYINGQPVVQAEGPAGYGRSNFPFNIGGGGVFDGTGNQFTGTLDEVAVFTSALTDNQLAAHVAAARDANGDYAATVLADGPLGYWGFNGGDDALNQGQGGTSLNGVYVDGDAMAVGANESLPGVKGDFGFAGESPDDGYVTVDSSILSGLTEFTLSGFVKIGDIFENRVGLFGQNDAVEFGLINPNTVQIWTPLGGATNFAFDGELEIDEWVHVAAIADGEEIRIYIDGEEVAVGGTVIQDEVGIDSYGASDFPFNVGGGGIYDATGNQFVGQIDEVAVWDRALTAAQIAAQFEAALGGGLVGDFDGSGVLDVADVDLLSAEIRGGAGGGSFDLNGDGAVSEADLDVWVNELKFTYFGDANLDGEFNSSDFVAVFQAGKFETGAEANWSEGDWNGDGIFGSGDFVKAFQSGGFEIGPRTATQSVPEPSSLVLIGMGMLMFVRRRR